MRLKLFLLAAMTLSSGVLYSKAAFASTALPSCTVQSCVTIGFCSIACNRCEEKQCVYNPFDE